MTTNESTTDGTTGIGTRNVPAVLATIDRQDADDFVSHLTDDVVFTFGNGPSVHGVAAVRAAVIEFWSTIGGLTHHVQDLWEVDDVSLAYIAVEYVRTDGAHVTVPNVDVLRWRGDKVHDWRVVIDLAPVFS